MKQPLKGRAEREHLDPAQYWDLKAKAAEETKYITDELIPRDAYSVASGGDGYDPERAWEAFYAKVSSAFMSARANPDPLIMRKAHNGDFEREAPSAGKVTAMFLLFCMAAAFEVCVFVVQGLFGGSFNFIIILLALLLATGGGLTGFGLGQLIHWRWRVIYLGDASARSRMDYVYMAVGIILIFTVSGFRAYGTGELIAGVLVFIITMLLGATCALFETLHVSLKNRREELLVREGQAQGWVANEEHKSLMETYHRVYIENLKRASKPGGRVIPPPPFTTPRPAEN